MRGDVLSHVLIAAFLGGCTNDSTPTKADVVMRPRVACADEHLVEVKSVSALPKELKSILDHYGDPREGLRDLNGSFREGSCGLIVSGTTSTCALVSLGCGGYVPNYLVLEYQKDQQGWHKTNDAAGGDPNSLQGLIEMARFVFGAQSSVRP